MSIVDSNSHVNRQYFLFMTYKSGLESPPGYMKTHAYQSGVGV